jgi:hypothetical protein
MSIRLMVLAAVVVASPALAQSSGSCLGDARSLERELTLNGSRLSPSDRAQAEQRLSRGQGLCFQDAPRASQDLEQLRRDMVQQALRPPANPGPPPPLSPTKPFGYD